MEGGSSPSPSPSPSASKLLTNLPSRGLFSSATVVSSNPGGMRVYVCEHDTAPPEGSHTHLSDKDLHTLTVERLRAL